MRFVFNFYLQVFCLCQKSTRSFWSVVLAPGLLVYESIQQTATCLRYFMQFKFEKDPIRAEEKLNLSLDADFALLHHKE